MHALCNVQTSLHTGLMPSAVPYFSPACGDKRHMDDMDSVGCQVSIKVLCWQRKPYARWHTSELFCCEVLAPKLCGVHKRVPSGSQILAYVNRVRDVYCQVDNETFTLAEVEANDVRCPDQEAAKAMYKGMQPSTPLRQNRPKDLQPLT